MKNQLLEEVRQELLNGPSKKRHPFRYFTLATIKNGEPKQRTVVLRKTLEDLSLVFYTDKRTAKIKDLQNNASFSALFYHPKKLLQIRIEGKAALITDKELIAKYWHTVQSSSRKDYTTDKAPGTPIKNHDNVEYESEENYFCPVKLIPNSKKLPYKLRILLLYKKMK